MRIICCPRLGEILGEVLFILFLLVFVASQGVSAQSLPLCTTSLNIPDDGDGVPQAMDIDKDGDGLIEICDLEGLDEIRYALDGLGYTTSADAMIITTGCPFDGCTGYELANSLDFTDDDSYRNIANKATYTVSNYDDSNDNGWQPVGDNTNPFVAKFDGNGHTISNLMINRSDTNYVGLFGYTGSEAEIADVGLPNVDIIGDYYAGGLVGWSEGIVVNSYATGAVEGGNTVGGLVGWNSGGTVVNSYAMVDITGYRYAGGLVGRNTRDGIITNSHAAGSVMGRSDYMGGLVGSNESIITNSYATGAVEGDSFSGGLVGLNTRDGIVANSYTTSAVEGDYGLGGLVGLNSGVVKNGYATGSVAGRDDEVGGLVGRNFATITNSYATGSVTGTENSSYVGGLIGDNNSGANITSSYWDINTSGITTSNGGTSKTTVALQLPTAATGIYSNWGADDWDFGTRSQYPVLKYTDNPDTDDSECRSALDTTKDLPVCGSLLSPTLRYGLSELQLVQGNLSPDFNVVVSSYRGTVVSSASTIQFVPTAVNPNAKIYITADEEARGMAIDSGDKSSMISLNTDGITTIKIEVENGGETTQTVSYTLYLNYYEFNGDIDRDDDGLIEIDNLERLDAMRYQLDGTGYRESRTAPKVVAGCPNDACSGYELTRSLDFTDNASYLNALSNQSKWTTGMSWQPIGNSSNRFNATFKGNGFTISNLIINRPDNDYISLFGYTGNKAEIANLGLLNVNITGSSDVGGLVGESQGVISNSYATGSVEGNRSLGGLVGSNSGTIMSSYATSSVSGGHTAGGLVGSNSGTIMSSYATGSIRGTSSLGGLVGVNHATIMQSYATGSVSGTSSLGGLVGANDRGTVVNSYATGSARGNNTIGGLVGYNFGNIMNSYAMVSVSGTSSLGGLAGWHQGFDRFDPFGRFGRFGSNFIISNSYWLREASSTLDDISNDTLSYVAGRTAEMLKSPIEPGTTTTDVYYSWDEALWDFGTSSQYPSLKDTDSNTLLSGLRDLKVLTAGAALNPTFTASTTHYVIDFLADTNSIILQLEAYNANATVEVVKRGEDTDYFAGKGSVGQSERILIDRDTELVITVSEADASTTTYTIGTQEVELSDIAEISGITVSENGAMDTDDTVNEGDRITLGADISGGGGNYRYEWTQTQGKSLMLLGSTTASSSFTVPTDYIASMTSTSSEIVIQLTLRYGRFSLVSASSKTLTIIKVNNETPRLDAGLTVDGFTLSFDDTRITDSDGGGTASGYQWQSRDINTNNWVDIDSATTAGYTVSRDDLEDRRYRVRVTYTDAQGYSVTVNVEAMGLDVDMDTDGLIEIYYIEDLDAIRYALDGSGYKADAMATTNTTGCPNVSCSGYELVRDLDFMDDDSYSSTANRIIWTTGAGWHPIGDSSNAFNGRFEGNGFTISNLMTNRPDTDYIGLFGYTESEADIANVGLLNVDIIGNNISGGLVGSSGGIIKNSYVTGFISGTYSSGGLAGVNDGTITNSYATGSVSGYEDIGGLVGDNNRGTVMSSYATGSVSGSRDLGGLVGDNNRGTIMSSYATGSVSGSRDIGGLVGDNNRGTIMNSYATGSVSGYEDIGGLVGWNEGTIMNSYATGSVSGDEDIGGLVGGQWEGTIRNSYWDINTSGITIGDNGTGRTTVALQLPTAATGIYRRWSSDNWDFGMSSQYPILKYTDNPDTDDSECRSALDTTKDLPVCGSLLSPTLRYGLSELQLVQGNLSPDFDVVVPSYRGTMVSTAGTIQFMPTAINSNAKIYITANGEARGSAINSGDKSNMISLNTDGITTIKIEVENRGGTIQTVVYTLYLNYYEFNGDVDRDDDGLIEIDNLEGLNAMRYQLDGTGYRESRTALKLVAGCPNNKCSGYELTKSLDFNDNISYLNASLNKSKWTTGAGWQPIGDVFSAFNATFNGNGFTISNLMINRSDTDNIGLLGYTGSEAEITNVDLMNVAIIGSSYTGGLVGWNSGGTVANSYTTGSVRGEDNVGGLVGWSSGGTVASSYATGSVSGEDNVGGLVGGGFGTIMESYAAVFVTGRGDRVGGLVGGNGSIIMNSYATGSVSGEDNVGGLVGSNWSDGTVVNSYAAGSVRGEDNVGGLVGWSLNGTVSNSYWDINTSGIKTSNGGTSKTTVELQLPTAATGIYRRWSSDNWDFGTRSQYPVLKYTDNPDTDDSKCRSALDITKDLPICGSLLSPTLRYGLSELQLVQGNLSPDFNVVVSSYRGTVVSSASTIQFVPTAINLNAKIYITANEQARGTAIDSGDRSSMISLSTNGITTITIEVENGGQATQSIVYTLYLNYYEFNGDVDRDDDGLIEIDNLEALNAMRYQLDGTGYRARGTAPKIVAGCPNDECSGYELMRSLDFTNNASYLNASLNQSEWTTESGWQPIGNSSDAFNATFNGNGFTISNLMINRPDNDYIGLFSYMRKGADIANVGLLNVDIIGNSQVGGLVGENSGGGIAGSYVTGSVRGEDDVGGLVGWNFSDGTIASSYATGSVSGDYTVGGLVGSNSGTIMSSYATSSISGGNTVGGLVGSNSVIIMGSYATGSISGTYSLGGLVGVNYGTIMQNYATGSVSGNSSLGGLVGLNNYGNIKESYTIGSVSGTSSLGGLVGSNDRGTVVNSYSTGSVRGEDDVGGLVGENSNGSVIMNSYSTGSVEGVNTVGGLVGSHLSYDPFDLFGRFGSNSIISYSYWLREASSTLDDIGNDTLSYVAGRTAEMLKSPIEPGTTTTDVYYSWDEALWDFGTSSQYPSLKDTDSNTLLSGLRDLKVLTAGAALNPTFTASTTHYVIDFLADTNSIILQLEAYNSDAEIQIFKQGDAIDYFAGKGSVGQSERILIDSDTELVITVSEADASTTTYTIGTQEVELSDIAEISGITVSENGVMDADDMVNEGDRITLGADISGGGGNYRYEWTQTQGKSLMLSGSNTASPSFRIPDDYIASMTSTSSEIVMQLTLRYGRFNLVSASSKTLTIIKVNNETPRLDAGLTADGFTLSFDDTLITDSDGGGTASDYQWQSRDINTNNWADIDSATTAGYTVSRDDLEDRRYRVRVTYTDAQGYSVTENVEAMGLDVDMDTDGLIEIYYIEDLDAIRYALDGSGYKADAMATTNTTGCPNVSCSGYELVRDLDFMDDDSYSSTANRIIWTTGAGWQPIGDSSDAFNATFNGNGFTLSNLMVNRSDTDYIGLFGYTGSEAEIANVGLLNVEVIGKNISGGLVGSSGGIITNSYVTGSVSGNRSVGGLVGANGDRFSFVFGTITNSYATGSVSGDERVGGLVGQNGGTITNSYATGSVSGAYSIGGLVGANGDRFSFVFGTITNSYATGSVSGEGVGGLVGRGFSTVTNSYWDVNTSGIAISYPGTSKTTVALQLPTAPGSASNETYYNWSTDNWDFGTSSQYPVLRYADNPNTDSSECRSADDATIDLPVCGSLLSPVLRYGLSELQLVEGNLSPDFDVAASSYKGTVVSSASTVRFRPIAINPDAKIYITTSGQARDVAINSGDQSSVISLNTDGITRITIEVENGGQTTQSIVYTLHLNYYEFNGDVDRDDDGLIEIDDLEGLNAMRYQLDGTGYRASGTAPKVAIGCPDNRCRGYELTRDLDFNDDASYSLTTNRVIWTTGAGWQPIGDSFANVFSALFEGNGFTISNLKIDRSGTGGIGLFGFVRRGAEITNVGLLDVDIVGNSQVGGLVGRNGGTVANSYATGFVLGRFSVGGLVGFSEGTIASSYMIGSVRGSSRVGGLVGEGEGDTITNSYATGSVEGTSFAIGGLVGDSRGGAITSSYATGSVKGDDSVGGLVGYSQVTITNSYATGTASGDENVGGLVGYIDYGNVMSSYATGSVSGDENVGGLAGGSRVGTITNSYATGSVSGDENVGGLVGESRDTITNSYWDINTSGITISDGGTGRTTVALQSPTAPNASSPEVYTGWSTDNWNFGTATEYPILKYADNSNTGSNECRSAGDTTADLPICGSLLSPTLRYGLSELQLVQGDLSPDFDVVVPSYRGTVVSSINTIRFMPTAVNPNAKIYITANGEARGVAINSGSQSGMISLTPNEATTITIEVENEGQATQTVVYTLHLNYYEFSGDVDRDDDGLIEIDNLEGLNAIRYQPDGTGYRASATAPKIVAGCPNDVCRGYELARDLDFNDNASYSLAMNKMIWTTGKGWQPVDVFSTLFEGNGFTISNLMINRFDTRYIGLFGVMWREAEISNVGLLDVDIVGNSEVGGLVGESFGRITNSYATGSVSGDYRVGGLVGYSEGTIANSYATGSISGDYRVGGLVGRNERGNIANSYATGSVSGSSSVGGLVGDNYGTVMSSYATGSVIGTGSSSDRVGGLVGWNNRSVTNSYWDINTSGIETSSGGTGKTTVELQEPTTATGIYSSWSTEVWDFGTSSQYPSLKDADSNTLLSGQGIGLRDLKVLTAGAALRPVFGVSTTHYVIEFLADTNSIILQLEAYNANATVEVVKRGEDTDYFAGKGSVGQSERILIDRDTELVITVSEADASTTTYTIGTQEVELSDIAEISGITVSKNGAMDTDDMVNEGDRITLGADISGGGGNYRYEWTQTQGKSLMLSGSTTASPSFTVPTDYIASMTSTSSEIVIQLTLRYGRFSLVSASSKTLTIIKVNNDTPRLDAGLTADGFTLSFDDTRITDSDGHGTASGYQWQSRDINTNNWADIDSATTAGYTVSRDDLEDRRYRVRVTYTDAQGYSVTENVEAMGLDIDMDTDGLIEIYYIEDLDAIRYALDGSGYKADAMATTNTTGCPNVSCSGYELVRDLDFMDDDSYSSTANRIIWTTGAGWQPIGDSSDAFNATFNGNGFTLSNLMINRSDTDYIGSFGYTGSEAEIANVGLLNVDIVGNSWVGSLVGYSEGAITNSYVTGSVSGNRSIGGLVGANGDRFSFVFGTITNSYATGSVSGDERVGGLVGQNGGTITNSYATGSVSGAYSIGGLVGANGDDFRYRFGTITNSYATGSVSGEGVGGLVGEGGGFGTVTSSYWDVNTSGIAISYPGTSKTTVALQLPTAPGSASNETYYNWSTDNWDFGTSSQYPVLRYADNPNTDSSECRSADDTTIDLPVCGSLLSPVLRYGLSELQLVEGNLSPDFDVAASSYKGTVVSSASTVRFRPIAINPDAKIYITTSGQARDVAINSGDQSSVISLNTDGITRITIEVENGGQTTQSIVYTLHLNYYEFNGDVDRDDDGLIEIDDLEGLNAMRYQLDGTGYRASGTAPKVA